MNKQCHKSLLIEKNYTDKILIHSISKKFASTFAHQFPSLAAVEWKYPEFEKLEILGKYHLSDYFQ